MKQMPRGREECLKENQRCDSGGPEEFVLIIEPLSTAAYWPGEKGLMIA
jgi:hypothetical protein